jgi:hypothetical protein
MYWWFNPKYRRHGPKAARKRPCLKAVGPCFAALIDGELLNHIKRSLAPASILTAERDSVVPSWITLNTCDRDECQKGHCLHARLNRPQLALRYFL